MKKILLGVCALLAVAGMSSCEKKTDTTPTPAIDSLSMAYGHYVGAMLNSDFGSFDPSGNADKKAFMEGIMSVFGNNKNLSTRMGMHVGIQMLSEIEQLNENGMNMDKAAVINAFKEVFFTDSLSSYDTAEYSANFRSLYSRAEAEAQSIKNKALEEAPEAVDNAKAGKEYVDKLRQENAEIKTTGTGLSYLIKEAGTDPKPEATSTVTVNYTGRHLNGDVFDSNEGKEPVKFNLQGVISGFREGLMLLGKGGKATLYIPGELAYGPGGTQGIEPNETLVFDVELVDFEN